MDFVKELLEGLSQLSAAVSAVLDANVTPEELTAAVGQMASGKAPGLDGLPSDFYKHFSKSIGPDLCEVVQECSRTHLLPS